MRKQARSTVHRGGIYPPYGYPYYDFAFEYRPGSQAQPDPCTGAHTGPGPLPRTLRRADCDERFGYNDRNAIALRQRTDHDEYAEYVERRQRIGPGERAGRDLPAGPSAERAGDLFRRFSRSAA